ncbi:MAG: glycosyl transferase family 4 [Faecalibacterium sp.]
MIRFALIVASVLGFALTAALGNLMVPLLKALNPAKAPMQAGEPWGALEDGVPTMGGLCLMVGVLAAVGVGWTAACAAQPELLGSGQMTTRLLLALGGALLFGAVGMADDLYRLRRRQPLGLRPGVRLLLEAGAAALILGLLAVSGCLTTGFSLPGTGYWELGGAAGPLWGLELVALAESARAAGTADGVACGTAFAAMLGLMSVLTILGWFPLAVLPAALAGALMAFLLWNFPPAKVRLGSTGSLFLAGAVGCVPLCIGWPGLAVPLALPWWLEGGMLLAQILAVRLTGKGLFRTAPLHRWLEKHGCSPISIFYRMCLLAFCGMMLTVGLARVS